MTALPIRRSIALALSLLGACTGGGAAPSGDGSVQEPSTTASSAGQTAPTAASAGMSAAPAASGASGKRAPAPTSTGSAGNATPPSAGSSAAGAMATNSAGSPAAGSLAAGSAGTAATAGVETGTLPVPDALDKPGPYEITDVPDTGPGNEFRLFAPKPLGVEGLKHPVLAWSPGAGAFPDAYLTLLNTLASHGFVTLSFNSTAEGPNLVDAIDWLISENDRKDSVLYQKLDTTKIAAGGHSAGSLATYQMADDARLTTTLHMSGGSFMPATDVPRLKKPALMVCGDAGGDGLTTGDLANPMCIADFELAKVPVFFAVVKGAGHAALNDAEVTAGVGTAPDDPHKLLFIKATIGWLRWQLAGDLSLAKMFVGVDCELCAAGSGYVVKQKDLN